MPTRLQMADPRVEDLVRAGSVRVALFPPMYTQHPVTGEIGGMHLDLARAGRAPRDRGAAARLSDAGGGASGPEDGPGADAG
ncbi:MAG TPA: hypothetical protein VLK82_00235 [Candidatus Tectomicrobia bacterium]|nr:hypothetical protein [Candidatus Tectomicrobia bacterium]